jgi:CheY-like chemotaxis protein
MGKPTKRRACLCGKAVALGTSGTLAWARRGSESGAQEDPDTMETTLSVIVVPLVEDDPGDVFLVREAFEFNKVRNELHVVSDGVEALDFLHRRNWHAEAPRPDLVLLDLNLPRKDGREVLEEIKADASLRAIPVEVLAVRYDAEAWGIGSGEQRVELDECPVPSLLGVRGLRVWAVAQAHPRLLAMIVQLDPGHRRLVHPHLRHRLALEHEQPRRVEFDDLVAHGEQRTGLLLDHAELVAAAHP